MWYAVNGENQNIEYSYNYQNWHPVVEYETKNTVENVGLFDLTPFSKYDLKGKNIHFEVTKICTSNVKNEIGSCTYTNVKQRWWD